MSDAQLMLVLILVTVGVLWLVGKFIVGPLLSKGLDVAESATKAVAEKARSVAAGAGHSLAEAALRVQSKKLIKMVLEVADQTTGANELGLDADLSRKNDELAERVLSRALDELGELSDPLPVPAIVATYALLSAASQLSPGDMREKLRIAGQAAATVVNQGSTPSDRMSMYLMQQSAQCMAQLDSQAFIEAFEKG